MQSGTESENSGHFVKLCVSFSESSPCIPSSTTPPSSLANVALSKPVPRPLGSSPAQLFSNPNSPLQSLLYRHPYLSGTEMSNACQNQIHLTLLELIESIKVRIVQTWHIFLKTTYQ